MVPGVKKVIKLGLDQWNQDATSTTKTNMNQDEVLFWKFSSNVEKVEANYAFVSACSDVRKDWRATIFNILVRNWWKTGRWNTKRQDTRYTLRKGADWTFKKAIDVCRADETTNHEMKIMKQKIDVDAVQKNRRGSKNDSRGIMQHTARAATSTITNNQQ